MTRIVDLTPTWAGLMPALVAALQSGTPMGATIAAEELTRLARAVDAMNAQAKAAPEEAPDMAPGIEAAARSARGAAASDLAGAARDFMSGGAYVRAACYWEAAARIAPADMEEARDFRVSADLAEKEAGGLLTASHDLARKAARGEVALSLANAGRDAWEGGGQHRAAAFYAAAAIACPDSPLSDQWGQDSRNAERAGQSDRAAAVAGAYAEGRRSSMEETRAALAALTQPHYGCEATRADHAGETVGILEAFRPVQVPANLALWPEAPAFRGLSIKAPDAIGEALDMARSCLAAFPRADLEKPQGAAALRGIARDFRDTLAALVATLDGGQA